MSKEGQQWWELMGGGELSCTCRIAVSFSLGNTHSQQIADLHIVLLGSAVKENANLIRTKGKNPTALVRSPFQSVTFFANFVISKSKKASAIASIQKSNGRALCCVGTFSSAKNMCLDVFSAMATLTDRGHRSQACQINWLDRTVLQNLFLHH